MKSAGQSVLASICACPQRSLGNSTIYEPLVLINTLRKFHWLKSTFKFVTNSVFSANICKG